MPNGIRLMKSIGFTEIEPLTPERRAFIINVKESGIPLFLKYKEKLRKWKDDRAEIYQEVIPATESERR